MENIILVDSSYTSFHRFLTMRWFSLAKKKNIKNIKMIKNDWSTNEIFFEKYKMHLDSIMKLLTKKFSIIQLSYFV